MRSGETKRSVQKMAQGRWLSPESAVDHRDVRVPYPWSCGPAVSRRPTAAWAPIAHGMTVKRWTRRWALILADRALERFLERTAQGMSKKRPSKSEG